MWTCPDCGRTFQRTRQSHYCGEAPKTVEAYIGAQPEAHRAQLWALLGILREALPGAKERILWSMPALEAGGERLSLCACRGHISLYVGREVLEACAEKLQGLPVRNSAVYLPYEGELPADLIRELARRCCGLT